MYDTAHKGRITFPLVSKAVVQIVRNNVPHRSRHIVSTDKGDFDARKFLATDGDGKQVLSFAKTQAIFAQGDAADAVFYVQEGKVRLTVVSKDGKEATIGILNAGDFCGEAPWLGSPCAWRRQQL